MYVNVIINAMVKDITDEWTKTQGKVGTVVERREYTVNGTTYIVDGKRVRVHLRRNERAIADLLAEKYGKEVELIPQITTPQFIQTPDYLIDGERFDLKSPTGRGKDVFRDAIKKKRKQSPNFIFDISNTPLDFEEIRRQVMGIFTARNTKFVEKIVLFKDGEVLKVYERK